MDAEAETEAAGRLASLYQNQDRLMQLAVALRARHPRFAGCPEVRPRDASWQPGVAYRLPFLEVLAALVAAAPPAPLTESSASLLSHYGRCGAFVRHYAVCSQRLQRANQLVGRRPRLGEPSRWLQILTKVFGGVQRCCSAELFPAARDLFTCRARQNGFAGARIAAAYIFNTGEEARSKSETGGACETQAFCPAKQ